MARTTTANLVDPAIARPTPSAPSGDSAQAAEVGTQRPSTVIHTAATSAPTVPVERTIVSGSGTVAALANEPQLNTFMSTKDVFTGKWSPIDGWASNRIPLYLKAHHRRLKAFKQKYVQKPIPTQTARHFWRRNSELLHRRGDLSLPAFTGFRKQARVSMAPRGIPASQVVPDENWGYLRFDLTAYNTNTANSYWAGNGMMRDGALGAAGGLGTFHQNVENPMEIHDEDGNVRIPPEWGNLLSSCTATLTHAPYFGMVPGSSWTGFVLRNGTVSGSLELKLFAMDPLDPHWNTATGGGYADTAAFASTTDRYSSDVPLDYINGSGEIVSITQDTRFVIVLKNNDAAVVSVASAAIQFVDPHGYLPDFTALMVPDSRTIDEFGMLQTQLGNQALLKCNASALNNQGSIVGSVLPPDWFESNDPSALDFATISTFPRRHIAPAKAGMVLTNPVTPASQEISDPETYWLSDDVKRPLWVCSINGAVAPFTLDQVVNMCVVQDGQLLPRVPCVSDILDFSRAQAIQAVLPVAHEYGETGETHNAFVQTVSAAYSAACILFPRLEQVGDFAMSIYDAVAGFFG